MNLKRTLRFSMIKLRRDWKRGTGELCAEIAFLLAPVGGKKNHPANNRRNTFDIECKTPKANEAINRTSTELSLAKIGENKGDEKPHSCRENVKFLFELLGIVGGLVGVIILICQLRAMQSQSDIMQGQLAEMRMQRELDERAWVFAEVQDNSLVVDGTNFTVQIQEKNVGKTPAIIIGVWDSESGNMGKIHDTDPLVDGLNVTVLPNHYQVVTSPDIPIANLGYGFSIYIWGTVYYSDIFGKSHWSQFCYALTDSGKNTKKITMIHNACDDTVQVRPH